MFQKQITQLNKITNNLIDSMKAEREEWESEMSEYFL